MPTPGIRRADTDACPGALRLHAAADGPLARVRLPGGLLTGGQLSAVRELAEEFGDGHVELTSRGNIQLRALTTAPAETLATRLAAAGLLPSATHELVRNIAASPLPSGAVRAGEVRELDASLCADPLLAGLPGRFLFALDSGALDVAGAADVAAVPAAALTGDAKSQSCETTARDERELDQTNQHQVYAGEVAVLFAGVDAGLRVAPADTVRALLAAAHAFLAEREVQRAAEGATRGEAQLGDQSGVQADPDRLAWRVRELVDGPARVAARTAAVLGVRLRAGVPVPEPGIREPVGLIGQAAGLVAVGAVIPLGRVSGVQMKVLKEAAAIVVTPWRGVVLPGLTPEAAREWQLRLADVGLAVHGGSRWSGVTACAGRPGCAKSLADVRRDAAAAVADDEGGSGRLPVHWVGCARGCGSPAGPHVRVEATGAEYDVRAGGSSRSAAVDEVGALVAAARRG